MSGFAPRPPAPERSSPLSPATLEVLRRLGTGQGGLLFLIGEDRAVRRNLLRAVASQAEAKHLESVALRAHPIDAGTPYGALQPWFARWYRPPGKGASERPSALDASFFTAWAGLLPTGSPTPDRRDGCEPTPKDAEEGPRPLGPEEMRAELLELVEGRLQERPAVVTVEDAEFVDPTSREWLSFLGGRILRLPLVMVLSLDPKSSEFERWRRELSQVSITWERWPAQGPREAPPPTLARRLQPLPPSTQEALAAAVLSGPDARPAVLAEALGWEPDRVDHELEPAVQAGLLAREQDLYTLAEPGLYPDLDGLLPASRRRALHAAIARVLEAQEPHPRGPLLFRLGEHWAEAGEPGRGCQVLMAAATEAVRWGSPELAAARLQRALGLAQADTSEKGREREESIYAQLGDIRQRASDPKGAAEAFERALDIAQQRKEEPTAWARYVSGLATARTRVGGDPEALLRSTLQQLEGRSSDREATLWASLGFYYRERGRTREAQEASDRAVQLAEKGQDVSVRALAYLDAAEACFFGGGAPELERAQRYLEKAIQHREELERCPDPSLLPMLLESLSHVALSQARMTEAVARGDEAIVSARRFGTRGCLLMVLGNQAELRLEVGDLARARELTQELRQQCDRYALSDIDVDRQQLYLLDGRVSAARGAFEPARRHLDQLVAAAGKAGTRYYLAQALAYLVEVCVQKGDLASARAYRAQLEREGVRQTLPGSTRRHLEEAEQKLGPPAG